MKKKIKAIEFGGVLKGRGIVNFDGSEQKWTLIERGMSKIMPRDDTDGKIKDNIKFAKKFIYFNEETGKYDYKIKISRDCLIHNIYPDIPVVNPTIANDEWMRCKFATSKRGLTSGLMFTIRKEDKKNDDKDKQDISKKSAICLVDALQIKGEPETEFARQIRATENNFSVSTFEFCSRDGERDKTSIHYNENIGSIRYEMEGRIDIDLMQFVKTTPIFGNMAIDEKWIDYGFFNKAMKSHFGDIADDYKVGHFAHPAEIKNISGAYCQRGVRLGDKILNELCKDVIKRLFTLHIQNNKGYADMQHFGIRFIYDDITEDAGEFTEINSVSDIDNLNMEFFDFWVEASDEDIIAHKKLADEILRQKKADAAAEDETDADKGDKKGKKSSKKTSESESNTLL